MRTHLYRDLDAAGLGHWRDSLEPLLEARLADTAHGDMPGWRAAVARIAALGAQHDTAAGGAELAADTVRIGAPLPDGPRDALREALLALSPWRKGPFEIGGVTVDTEWRSDLKWRRIAAAMSPLAGRRVLDVGCGNGYYALRMHGAGVDCVVGVDPTLVYVMQFEALATLLPPLPVHVLPLRLEELPPAEAAFDTIFSMGVLYHQRSPIEHLRTLRRLLAPGGELVLETLILPGDEARAATPPGRYARMRNVWLLPTRPELTTWLARTGWHDIRVADVSVTTPDEQRTTEWMPFESLAEALDPADPTRTVEGWPAPRRAAVIAIRR
ncbi:MAG: tRNA 5-methoxyuridine(34)/uridine 5-oxyacetic acid(34) synthase CmoB [Woeseiaceae bacterium]|nr:tRNA 5-methoxyuridine(34)/uridine 5-oxyacetic acid(34) synthase CmoB [Woeseiaceae bacterium]